MIEAFLNYLQYEKRYSDKTVESYKIDILQFFYFIKDNYQIDDLLLANHTLIRTWVVELVEKKNQPSSIKRKISALKSFYKYYLRIGNIKVNPADKVNTPKTPERLPKFVEQQNINLLFNEPERFFEQSFEGIQEKLIMDILYSTGIRRNELIQLTWSDINFSTQQIKVTGKGNKQRLIPIGNQLCDSLKIFQQTQKDLFKDSTVAPYVFLTKEGNQLYPNFVYRIVKKQVGYCSTTDKKSPHVLRHSFATHMSNNGAKLNDIKELLGHASLASTQVYTHNTIEQLKEIYKTAHPKS